MSSIKPLKAMPGGNQPLTWCALLCLSLNAPSTALAAEYEVDGEIAQRFFRPDGSVRLVQQSKFTVFVKDCSWLIQTTNLDEAGTPVFENQTSSTNGGTIYSVGRRLDKNNVPGKPRGSSGWNPVEINPGNVPVGQDDGYLVCHLWLMFASGCYFANLSTNSLTPVYDSNASVAVNPNLKREAKWRLINGPGSLPFGVTYMKGPFDVDATYLKTGVTNVGDLRIPSGFVFEHRVRSRFGPGPILPGASAPAYHFRKRAVATVTAIRPFCSRIEFIPITKAGEATTGH